MREQMISNDPLLLGTSLDGSYIKVSIMKLLTSWKKKLTLGDLSGTSLVSLDNRLDDTDGNGLSHIANS
jgi:hypothetical protein